MNLSQTVMMLRTDDSSLNEASARNELGARLTVLSWILQVLCAAILFQTLFFKFTAAEESVYIFRTLGMEP